ncbi:hypothetical protein ACVW0Q_001940 [Thermostichus sp. MS-CIW-21]|jgi:hypothetical protein|uniref:hypothetical protein n=1 Tax=unclassified Synechococcus TaxID=2626047 RepID=UPI00006944A1|nr:MULTISPECIES: hypothetical protein [unclassified Synechococcus]ABC99767.1 conserved hypothetical protein [Synechococcus sp. JA-3-3Ab]PIK87293.1 hypothetical protein SYN63AY4M2_13275 [Synechococcus sp. 63AY4M2]PIK88216.1 hypothetical protein SYN65AY6A5_03555 [Synechococcus sp. 65AY6A5]PIK92648.1 hypothetical protein SYN65AY6LI_10730 [Synechococcus sp. 65AY6Li]PIK94005.1 hypothetical protein SYN60AY4M2_00300 [Synechococcus sp. 60AY4M2]
MVGIFRRFFGSRGQADSKPSSGTAAQPAKKKDNTFFLDPDEAKTLGNIEYMRTPRIVKHTFQDFGSTEKVEVVEQVSSLSKVKLAVEQAKAPEQSSSTSNSSSGAGSRRQGGSDMDMFRNMARSLKRK